LVAGSFCLTTVPITAATQISVSSEIEKRIDDSSSTASRTRREPTLTSTPAVENAIGRLSGPGGPRADSAGIDRPG
jgi:hypothetical protein